MKLKLFILFLSILFIIKPAYTHDLKWVKVDIIEMPDEEWKIIMKTPIFKEKVPNVSIWIEGKSLTEITVINLPNDLEASFSAQLNEAEIIGKTLSIKGLESLNLTALVQLHQIEKIVDTRVIKYESDAYKIPVSPSKRSSFLLYFKEGFRHLLKGYDHLLFLLLLTILIGNLRTLVKVVTIFTIAHSITIILTALNFIALSSTLIEVMIALSIFYL